MLYSGHPTLMSPDIVVVPNGADRWSRLQGRSGWKPNHEEFDREQLAYENVAACKVDVTKEDIRAALKGEPTKIDAIKFLPIVVWGSIPDPEEFVRVLHRELA